jgi:CPA1 family monovalent cation:H+ antiporter
MLSIACSGVVARFVKFPLPFLQVGAGVALGFWGLKLEIQSSLFFVLFAGPLLFDEAWRISKRELKAVRWTVTALAVGLVMLTVVGVGLVTNIMLPAVPLAAAFALAAALSPTDAVALKSLPGHTAMSPRLQHILEGEALINDATGLVCLQLAIAAVGVSRFSFSDAALNFVWAGGGGLAIGGAVTWGFRWMQRRIIRFGGEHAPTQVLLGLLLPLVAYLCADILHMSGILAAVGAGFTMDRIGLSGTGQLATRMQRGSVWDMLEFTLNGFIFVLLGLQLPLMGQQATGLAGTYAGGSVALLISYPLILWGIIGALRLIWILFTVHFSVRRDPGLAQHGQGALHGVVLALSLGGVRGVLTLAAALSIPENMSDGVPFPARILLVFLAAGTILVSMTVTTLVFPIALRRMKKVDEGLTILQERRARRILAEAAIAEIEKVRKLRTDAATAIADRVTFDKVAAMVMDEYLAQVDLSYQTEGGRSKEREFDAVDRRVRLVALQAERKALYPLRASGGIDEAGFRTLLHELDVSEAAIVGNKEQR